jgi:dienelactone hydrolase
VTQVWIPQRPGRSPLVVFAHGFQVGPAPYTALLQTWAAHGYVVAAPEFPLTDAAVAGSNLDEADIDNQPADVRFVTNFLVSSSPVAAQIDPGKVAIAGHSDGAETALAAATSPAGVGQPVYRAVIAFGVQPVPGAAGRNPPILVGQGDEDTINPPSYGYSTFAAAASPKYLLVLRGGGHLAPLEAGSAWLPGIEAETEAFMDAYVAGDEPVGAIRSIAGSYPNLSIEAG